jgi:hypothetical protein
MDRDGFAITIRRVLGFAGQVSPDDGEYTGKKNPELALRRSLARESDVASARGYLRVVPSFDVHEYSLRGMDPGRGPLLVYALSARGEALLDAVDESNAA